MKTALQFLKFYLITALFVGGLTFLISLVLYILEGLGQLSVLEIIQYSIVNGILNGLILGFLGTVIVTLFYYYNAAKTNRHNKKVLKQRASHDQ